MLENGDSVCADCEDTIARAELFFSESYGRATLDAFAAHQAQIDAHFSEPARLYLAGRLGLS
ncbi:hypothetical protein OR16_04627 [Cupriavidus basilensis OR16]|uniref:Uncharacterized protein n=1 Tax=Cupriavidus basilensis OR16 TaxID=1127483 RepID=H1S017_9BURK|nr:hypothetical protein OR16_04627 [Cupriavidus basilensis OR16]